MSKRTYASPQIAVWLVLRHANGRWSDVAQMRGTGAKKRARSFCDMLQRANPETRYRVVNASDMLTLCNYKIVTLCNQGL